MKILYITPGCFDKGGISRYSRYQIRALQEIYGLESIRVVSMLGPDKDQFEDGFDVYWHGNGEGLKRKVEFARAVYKLAVRWKPDVIHSAHAHYAGLIHLLARIAKATSVLNVYGIEVWSDPSAFVSYGLRHVNYILSDCHNTAEYVAKEFRNGIKPDVVWDCVDLDRFSYDEKRFAELAMKYQLPSRETSVTILTLGRLSRDAAYKGYERLIDVFERVFQIHPHARLIIAGKGDLASTLKECVRRLNLLDAVTFTGSIAEEDLPSLYAYCDIFSMVTEAGKGKGEGLPLTPLEAMACRTPIIVGNQDGSREAVFENQNGFVIDPNDLNQHINVLVRLIEDTGLRTKMSQRAEELARIHFSYAYFRSKHNELYSTFVPQHA